MPGAERAEIYFIAAMMLLIMILSVVAIYFFVKTYKKEMRERPCESKKRVKAPAPTPKVEIKECRIRAY